MNFKGFEENPYNLAVLRIRIQGVKYQPKTFFTPESKIWTFEKREIIKISSFLNGFGIKIFEKNKKKNSEIIFC